MWNRHLFPIGVASLLVASGCGQGPVDAASAREAADAYFAAKYSADPSLYSVRVKDGGHEWLVTYLPKGEAVGGTTTVVVEKKAGKIQGEYGTQ